MEPDPDDEVGGPSLRERLAARSTTELLRIGSVVLLVVGALLFVAWLWGVVRNQQRVTPSGFIGSGDFHEPGPSLLDRLDILVGSMYGLGQIAMVGGAALALRAFADVLDRRP